MSSQSIKLKTSPERVKLPASDPLVQATQKLKEAESLRQARKLQQSKRLCENLLRQYPDYVGVLHTLGLVRADMEQFEDAASHLGKAAMLCPRDWRIHTALSGVNLRLKRADTAIANLEQAQKLKPDDSNIVGTLAEVYRDQKEYELAIECFEKLDPRDDEIRDPRYILATCYEHLGKLEKVAQLYESLMEEGQCNLEVVAGLAQLPESLVSANVSSLLEDLPDPPADQRPRLDFARAWVCHRSGEHEDAWQHLVAANEPKRQALAEDWRSGRGRRQKQLDWAKSIPVTRNKPKPPEGYPASLFILGPSRCGKTTLEYLVSALPGVKRGYENPIVENTVRRTMQISGCPTRKGINGMPPGLDPDFLDFYLEELRERAGSALVFTNTHPGKISEVLRYAKAIPGSRFLFVKRAADDVILRTYMKNYATGNAYGFAVKTIKEHMDWYYAMIDVCVEKLPAISRVLTYEEMIEDPSSALRAAGDLCGIDVEADVAHKTGDDRGVAEPYRAFIGEALAG